MVPTPFFLGQPHERDVRMSSASLTKWTSRFGSAEIGGRRLSRRCTTFELVPTPQGPHTQKGGGSERQHGDVGRQLIRMARISSRRRG